MKTAGYQNDYKEQSKKFNKILEFLVETIMQTLCSGCNKMIYSFIIATVRLLLIEV